MRNPLKSIDPYLRIPNSRYGVSQTLKGGDWYNDTSEAKAFHRYSEYRSLRDTTQGFRLFRTQEKI